MTASVPATEAFIGFQLAQMSARNEHHEFEAVAVRIARRRISSNILLATGPVSGGGDQKRDGESYFTRVPEELPYSAGFAATVTAQAVVVACTTQKDGVVGKVRADLAGICAADAAPVERVAYFSVHNISAAAKHELQRHARKDRNVELDIFCGDDLSTILAEPDLVWVAVHYLDLPTSMVPEPEDESSPEWYSELLNALRITKGPAALTLGELGIVSGGIRYATWDPLANADLPEWIDYMSAFLDGTTCTIESEVAFRAAYEIAVARLRGTGTLIGAEDLIRNAHAYALGADSPSILEDASVLASYWGGAWMRGLTTAAAAEITESVAKLKEHTLHCLNETDPSTHPVRAASLTSTMAFLFMIPDWSKVTQDHDPTVESKTGQPRFRGESVEIDTSFLAGRDDLDLRQAMVYLRRLVDLLPLARPFPVGTVAKVFQIFAPALIDDPDYVAVRDGLDEATEAVEGESARAERYRDRAMKLAGAGRPLDALNELHQAKIFWWHGDTFKGAALVMRYIAKIYSELNLMYAAKQYSCAAAAMAITNPDQDITQVAAGALLETASYMQAAGCWADAAAFANIAVLARHSLLPNAFDYDEHPELEHLEGNVAIELAFTRKYWPELEPLFMSGLAETGWAEGVSELAEMLGQSIVWTEEDFQAIAREQFSGPIFGDVGSARTMDFRALGSRWTLTCHNDRETVLATEAICAALQVVLADICQHQPVLADAWVRINVKIRGDESATPVVEIDDQGPHVMVEVEFPRAGTDDDQRQRDLLTVAMMLIDAVHTRPSRELAQYMDSMFAAGLPNKIAPGRPYEDAAGLLTEEHYVRCAAASSPKSSGAFEPSEALTLAHPTSTGAGYDADASLERIRDLYEHLPRILAVTFPRLLKDTGCRARLAQLRSAGWLDWQILQVIHNVVMNWRLEMAGLNVWPVDKKKASEIARQVEDEASPEFPLERIRDQDLTLDIDLYMAAVSQRWKLQMPTRSIAPGSLRELLVRRYRFAVDDVDHLDIFECVGEEGSIIQLIS